MASFSPPGWKVIDLTGADEAEDRFLPGDLDPMLVRQDLMASTLTYKNKIDIYRKMNAVYQPGSLGDFEEHLQSQQVEPAQDLKFSTSLPLPPIQTQILRTSSLFEIPRIDETFMRRVGALNYHHTDSFDFLPRIPAEIRNAIYTALFVSSQPLPLAKDVKWFRDGVSLSTNIPSFGLEKGFSSKRDVKTDRLCLSTNFTPFGSEAVHNRTHAKSDRLSLAFVSKQMASEVLPLVYSKNTFDFKSARALTAFLDTVNRKSIKQIRSIRVPGAGPWNFDLKRSNFDSLALATNLTSLTINHESLYRHALSDGVRANVGDLVRQLKPFLNGRRSKSGENAMKAVVMDVVKVVHFPKSECDGCTRSTIPGRCAFGEQNCTRVQAALKIEAERERDEAHLKKVSDGLREAIAKVMGIEPNS